MRRTLWIGVWGGVGLLVLLAVGVALWLASPTEAPPVQMKFVWFPGPTPPPPMSGQQCPESVLGRRVFVDVNAETPRNVIQELAGTLGCPLEMDAKLKSTVTLRLSNVTASTALNAVCEGVGCRWRLADGMLRVEQTAPPPSIPDSEIFREKARKVLPASFAFKRAALGEVVKALSDQTGIEFLFEGVDLSTQVTVDLSDLRFIEAVQRLLNSIRWQPLPSVAVVWQRDRYLVRVHASR